MKDLYKKAIQTWGAQAQTLMFFEEMAELQKELCKNARGKDNRAEIAGEIADVQIMLEQMMMLHDCADEVQKAREYKLGRLAGRLGVEGRQCGKSMRGMRIQAAAEQHHGGMRLPVHIPHRADAGMPAGRGMHA